MHGMAHNNRVLQACDLVIAVGTRLSDRTTGKAATFAGKAKVVQIDVDPAEIGKNIGVDVPIVGDIGSVLQALLREGVSRKHDDWAVEARRGHDEWAAGASAARQRARPPAVGDRGPEQGYRW